MKMTDVPSRREPPIVCTLEDLRRYCECISTSRLESRDLIVLRISCVGESIFLYSVSIGSKPAISSQINFRYVKYLLAHLVFHAVRGASTEF